MGCRAGHLSICKPAVGKRWLYLSAGLVWFGVGMMLISLALRWLSLVSLSAALLLVLAGSGTAACLSLFGFSKLAKKNGRRIGGLGDTPICLFAFQEWKSYPLVIFMICLGIYLRLYSPIPKPLLALLYLGIGGGLASASFHYFARILERRAPLISPGRPDVQ